MFKFNRRIEEVNVNGEVVWYDNEKKWYYKERPEWIGGNNNGPAPWFLKDGKLVSGVSLLKIPPAPPLPRHRHCPTCTCK